MSEFYDFFTINTLRCLRNGGHEMASHYRLIVITVITMLLLFSTGCVAKEPPEPMPDGTVTDYASLVDKLRSTGATVNPAGEVSQPFFSVKGSVINVNGGDVQVFEYQDATKAESEAAQVSPDGSSTGTTIISWVAPPHFYKTGKLIVLYVGDNQMVKDTLDDTLGSQFAGR